MERWLAIPGFEGSYEVSDLGRVRSLDRVACDGKKIKGRAIKLIADRDGYLQCALWKGGKGKTRKVHRLVLEAFVGPCPKGMAVRHFPDRDPANNNIQNISWCDHVTNNFDKKKHGTHLVGADLWNAKLTNEIVRQARMDVASGISQREVARRLGICPANMSLIVNGKAWTHAEALP